MNKLIPAVLAAVLCISAAPNKSIKSVPPAVIKIGYSTVNKEGEKEGYICSAFYINLITLVTAEHCLPPDKHDDLVNMATGEILRVKREGETIAILEQSLPASVSPLRLAKHVEMGEHLWSFGYAEGEFFVGLQRNAAGIYDGDLILDGPIIHGMSGGPTVNDNGEVVGVNEATNSVTGVVCMTHEIEELIK